MEDVKAYIESGILELYVLGDISTNEKLEVEAMASQHLAVKAELAEIERSMEMYADVHSIEPAEDLRDRVLKSLATNLSNDTTLREESTVHEAKVVQIVRQKNSDFFKYAFAACLALLVLSVAALFTVYNTLQNTQGQLVAIQQQSMRFSNRVNLLDHQLNLFRDPSVQLVQLGPGPAAPKSGLAVAWSPSKKEVMIDLSRASNMPVNDKEHSYQLWALVGGKPVDLGVFDVRENSTAMIEMKSIAKADAFAVTLEPRGGLPSPTMANLMVVGKTEAE